MRALVSNGLIMITLIYTKEIIHLSDPVDETRFFAYFGVKEKV